MVSLKPFARSYIYLYVYTCVCVYMYICIYSCSGIAFLHFYLLHTYFKCFWSYEYRHVLKYIDFLMLIYYLYIQIHTYICLFIIFPFFFFTPHTGYGHVTPLSQTGKIFCIIYAAIGIPLTLVLLSAMVERLLVPASWLLGTLNSKLGHLYQPFNIRLLHLSIVGKSVLG